MLASNNNTILLCLVNTVSFISLGFKNDGTQDLFCFLAVGWKPSFAQRVLYLSTVSVPICPFQVDAGTMLYRVDSYAHLQSNEG